MILGIDHVVILVNDLEQAMRDYSALGFTVVPGGEHTDGATHNALVAFADGAYLELIAFKRPAVEHRWWHHTQIGPGLIDFALLPANIAADIAAMAAQGLSYNGPIAGGRQRPDGQRIAWQLGLPLTPDLPFLCADVTLRGLRVPEGAARQHPNGVTGIANITVVVRDIGASMKRYRALIGAPQADHAQLSSDVVDEAGVQGAIFALGSGTLTLAAPQQAEPGPLHHWLATRGEGICRLTLRSTDPPATPWLDLERTHGVPIEVTR